MASSKKTLADFQQQHDRNVIVPKAIRDTLARMEKDGGPDNWTYEGDFIKLCKISQTDLGKHRPAFEKHFVMVGGKNPRRVWVANAKMAQKFRESLES